MKYILSPFALLYQLITTIRNCGYNKNLLKSNKLDIPVISVGNITAGGTGKTPFTISLANLLVEKLVHGTRVTRFSDMVSSDRGIGNGYLDSIKPEYLFF